MQETTVKFRMTLSEINALARVVADWAEVAGEDDGINEGPLRAYQTVGRTRPDGARTRGAQTFDPTS